MKIIKTNYKEEAASYKQKCDELTRQLNLMSERILKLESELSEALDVIRTVGKPHFHDYDEHPVGFGCRNVMITTDSHTSVRTLPRYQWSLTSEGEYVECEYPVQFGISSKTVSHG